MRAISPLIATVIIVAITLSITVVVALWVSGVITGYTGLERLDVYDTYCVKYQNNYYMILYLKNSGTKPITIDNIFIDNKPYKQTGFKAFFVNEENFDPEDLNNGHLDIQVSINGILSSPYSGSVFGGDLCPSINVTYNTPVTLVLDSVIRFDNLSYSFNTTTAYDFTIYTLGLKYAIGFANNTISDYMLNIIYYENYKQLNITLLSYTPVLHRTTLYSGYVDLGKTLANGYWHDVKLELETYSNLSLWRLSFLVDGKTIAGNIPLYNTSSAISTNITMTYLDESLPTLWIPGILTSQAQLSIRYSLDIDKLTLSANKTVIKEYDFNDKNALALTYKAPNKIVYQYKDLTIEIASNIGFTSEPIVQIIIVTGKPLPYTLMPGQKAVLVLSSPNVSPGTLYSIIVHSSSGYKYPADIRAP